MANDDWNPNAIFDAPVTRKQVEAIRIERPAEEQAVPAVLPPHPDQGTAALRAALENPKMADEVLGSVPEPVADEARTGDPRKDESLAAELAMSLYLLHAVHSQNSPAQEHLPRQVPPRDPDEDRDDQPRLGR